MLHSSCKKSKTDVNGGICLREVIKPHYKVYSSQPEWVIDLQFYYPLLRCLLS